MKRAIILVALLVGLAGFSSGCVMVGPDYLRPTAKIAPQWLEYEDPRLKTTSPVEPLWWRQAFQDPVLDRLVEEALAENLTLRSAGLRVVQARQQLLITVGTIFPQQQFIAADAATVDPGAGAGSSQLYNLDFNLSWEIDVWGQIRRSIQSASAALDASLSSYDGVQVLLIGQVAQTYLAVRTTEQRLEVARRNVTYQEESVSISQAKFEAGETSSLDFEQGQTLLFNTQASVARLEQSLQQFKIALAILLGRLPQDLSDLLGEPRPIPTVSPVLAVGMPQDLIRRRHDIRVAERKLAAQSAQIGVAVADLYPQFTLAGFIGPTVSTVTGQQFVDLFKAESISYSYGGGCAGTSLTTDVSRTTFASRTRSFSNCSKTTARPCSGLRARSRAAWSRSSSRFCSSRRCSERRTRPNGPSRFRWNSTRKGWWSSTRLSTP